MGNRLEGLRIAQRRPIEWLREHFGVNPWSKQRAVIESVRDNRITAVKSNHGAGKSWTAAHVVDWFSLTFPFSKTVTTAPTFSQVETILWQEIRASIANAKIDLGTRPLQTEWKIDDNWFAMGRSADKADNFQGIHAKYVLLVVDEASGVPEEIWKGIRALMSGGHVRLLAIGNPTDGTSYFASLFRRGDVSKITITAFDTPNFTELGITLDDIRSGEWRTKQLAYLAKHDDLPAPHLVTPEWVADIYNEEGETSPFWQSRVMAEFPSEGDDTLIPLKWIEAAQMRDLAPSTPSVLGVDIAWMGNDKSVFNLRRGWHSRKLREVRGADPDDVADIALELMEAHEIERAVVDLGAMGPGVYSLMRKGTRKRKGVGSRVVGVNFGAEANQPDKFVNFKAEMFWNLRGLYKEGVMDIDPKDSQLATQLSAIKYKITEERKAKPLIMIEKKSETKKTLSGKSPDDADAQALAFAAVKAQGDRYKKFVEGWA